MTASFDPYHRWLGIPPKDQPPHHYRLLGLDLYESDPDVIESAADRQMTHVRSHQSGQHGNDSQRLLNEISAAKVCLLSPSEKAAYDERLRQQLSQLKTAQPLAVAQPLAATKPPAAAPPSKAPSQAPAQGATAGGVAPALIVAIGAGALALLLLMGGGLFLLFGLMPNRSSETVEVAVNPPVVRERESVNTPPVVSEPPVNPPTVRPPLPVTNPPITPAPVVKPPEPNPPITEPPPTEPPVTEPPDAPPPADPPPLVVDEPEPADTRTPIPDQEARDAKAKQIADLFPVDDARTFQEKTDLAKLLLKTGNETPGDAAAQFVLYNMTRELAADAGDAAVAFAAVDALDRIFQVDGNKLRVETIATAASATAPATVRTQTVRRGIELVDRLFAVDEYVEAGRLVTGLTSVARNLRDRELIDALSERRTLGRELFAGHQGAQAAIEKLKENPEDSQAAQVAGTFYALTKGDWRRGLPMLAAGSDEQLRQLAEQELAPPSDAAGRKKMADSWMQLGEASKGIVRDRQLARAAMWYRRIQRDLSGLAKLEVARRLEQIGELPFDGGDVYRLGGAPTEVVVINPPTPVEEPMDTDAPPETALAAGGRVVCEVLQAKTSPKGLIDGGVAFNGPSGDGRRGANGIVVAAPDEWTKRGTVWHCTYRRGGTARGVQFIHPLAGGHVVVTVSNANVQANSVATWPDERGYTGRIGSIPLVKAPTFAEVFKLGEEPHELTSQLLPNGVFGFYVDGNLMAAGRFTGVQPLDMTAAFKGNGFDPRLAVGQGGMIIGPMDGGTNRAENVTFDLIGEAKPQVSVVKPAVPDPEVPRPRPVDLDGMKTIAALQPKRDNIVGKQGGLHYLIKDFDPQEYGMSGDWQKPGGTQKLAIDAQNDPARLMVPYAPPDEYILMFTAKRIAGDGPLVLNLPIRGQACTVILDAAGGKGGVWAAGVDGSAKSDVQTAEQQFFPTGEDVPFFCDTRGPDIEIKCHGAHWTIKGWPAWTGVVEPWAPPQPEALAFMTNNAQFEIDKLALTPFGSTVDLRGELGVPVRLLKPMDREVDLLAHIDLKKDGIKGDWLFKEGALVSPKGHGQLLRIPCKPPREYRLDMEVTRQDGDQALVFNIPVGGRSQLMIDNGPPHKSDWHISNAAQERPKFDGTVLPLGERVKLSVVVTEASYQIEVGGRKLMGIDGPKRGQGGQGTWTIEPGSFLGIGASNTKFTIHSMQLTPLTEGGRLLRDPQKR